MLEMVMNEQRVALPANSGPYKPKFKTVESIFPKRKIQINSLKLAEKFYLEVRTITFENQLMSQRQLFARGCKEL